MAGSPWTNQLENLIIVDASVLGFTGFFGYAGAPAAGNLILSATAGAGTDPEGNEYLAEFAAYDNGTGSAIAMNGDNILFYTGSLAGGWTEAGSISYAQSPPSLFLGFNSVQLDQSATSTIPYGTISNFPVDGGAALPTVIAALNALWTGLEAVGVI